LTTASYQELEKPSKADPERTFGLVQANIYDDVIMKYMSDMNSHSEGGTH
jgi:hypothetical protein